MVGADWLFNERVRRSVANYSVPTLSDSDATEWNNKSTLPEYRPVLTAIGKSYAHVHGYVSVIVCAVSILVNLATVVVLTRRQMVSPSNTMLTGVAVTEILKLAAYAVYAYEFNVVTQIDSDVVYPLGWIYYLIVHASLSLVLYAIVTWLTVLLAIFRYIVVCVQQGQQLVTIKVARITILCVYLFSATVYIPSYFSLFPIPAGSHDDANQTLNDSSNVVEPQVIGEGRSIVSLEDTSDDENNTQLLARELGLRPLQNTTASVYVTVNATHYGYSYDMRPNLYSSIKIIHGPVLKLLASVLITVPTTLLIIKMQQAAKKRIILKGSSRRMHEDEEIGPRRVTFRERISSAATIFTTLPERISFSVRRQSTRSPQPSPRTGSPAKSSAQRGSFFLTASPMHAKSECAIVVNPPSDQQVSTARAEMYSNSNGETHHSDVNASSKLNIEAYCVIQVQRTAASPTPARSNHGSQKGSQEHHRRTTLLLLAVVMCFVVVEFPHGIMLLIGELHKDFYDNVYAQLGDLLDLVTLCSSSLNFVLYCAMSRQFRTTFAETFIAPILRFVPCLTRQERLASSGSVRITYARKRSNAKKPPLGAVLVSNPKYIAIQPPTQIEEEHGIDNDNEHVKDEQDAVQGGKQGGSRPPLLSVNSACLAIPSHVSEISVSVFSGVSNASHVSGTSHGSGMSHLSALSATSHLSDGSQQSGGSYRSQSSAQSNCTTMTTTTATSTNTNSSQFS